MRYVALFFAVLFGLLAFIYSMAYIEAFFGIIEPNPVPIVLYDTNDYENAFYELMGQDVLSAIVAILSIVLYAFFMSKYHRYKKKKKPLIKKECVEPPYILYLRSFVDDKITLKNISSINDSRSEEEVMVGVLSEIAPVYAIGDPKDKKMPVGATRLYVDDDHWKSTVEYMAQRAVLVVLRLGQTNSFWWEVEMALAKVDRRKLLFIVPYSKTFSSISVLYKMLLDHGVDISGLNIAVEKKSKGSISSFLYFDNDSTPQTSELYVPRFTRMIYSYEDILKNSMSDFLSGYGIIRKNKKKVRLSRIIQLGIILYLVFICFSRTFKDYADLRYQMPYELVESCVENEQFVKKYSDEVNGNNLLYSLIESKRGSYLLSDDMFADLAFVEISALEKMSADELEQVKIQHKGMLLMIKKYSPEYYDWYVSALSDAVTLSLENEEEAKLAKEYYQSEDNELPQWIVDFYAMYEDEEDDYQYTMAFVNLMNSHIDDPDIGYVLKVLEARL